MTDEAEITAKFSAAELQGGRDEQAEPAMHAARLLIGAKTDLGRVRENNEDKFEFYIPSDLDVMSRLGSIIAVADGMGGHAAGQIASELGLKALMKSYYSQEHCDVEFALRAAVREANSCVHQAASIGGRSGMGCTLTAAAVRGTEVFVGQVGDSRLYHFHGGHLEQVTHDHSWVGEQVRMGVLTEEEAESSPFRNVITRSLGTYPEVEPDIFRLETEPTDCLLLCSDGLSGVVTREQMEQVVSQCGPAESCDLLVDMALDAGGPDNVTVLIARVEEIEQLPEQDSQTEKKGLWGVFGRGD